MKLIRNKLNDFGKIFTFTAISGIIIGGSIGYNVWLQRYIKEKARFDLF